MIAGRELLKASGTVTGKLMRWLAAREYIDKEAADEPSNRAHEASREFQIADRLGILLRDVTDHAPAVDPAAVANSDWVEDYLEVADVEPVKIWFDGGVELISVPPAATDLARCGWSAFVTAARIGTSWHLLEVGVVYP
jgi:hypothetical protein